MLKKIQMLFPFVLAASDAFRQGRTAVASSHLRMPPNMRWPAERTGFRRVAPRLPFDAATPVAAHPARARRTRTRQSAPNTVPNLSYAGR